MKTARWCAGLAGAALVVCPLAFGQTSAPTSDVDPAALEVIQSWINAPAPDGARLIVSDSVEQDGDAGQKVTHTHRRTATVERPNHLRVETRGDLQNQDLIYDGETVTIFDHDHNVYGQIAFEGSIDEMMGALHQWYAVETPLSDLLRADRSALLAGVETGEVVGSDAVQGHDCDHVAFTSGEIDWEAWIDSGETPVMRQMAITYKSDPGAPQYVLTLEEAEALDDVDDSVFEFEAPEGATLIRFLGADEIFGPDDVVAETTETEVTQ